MKQLLIIISILWSTKIYAQDDKEVNLAVSGQGKTIEEAKTNGFRSAIEQAYGVFISSNTEVLNDNVIKDEIISISNGNIKEFKVLDQRILSNGDHYILLNTTVSITKLTYFCESKGISIEFKGGLLAENLKLRRLQEKNEIAILENLSTICKEFLANSFDYNIKYDSPKFNIELKKWEIPLTVTINQNQNFKNLGYQIYTVLNNISLKNDEIDQYKDLNLPYYNIFFAVQGDNEPAPAVVVLRTEKGVKIISDIILSVAKGLLNFSINDGITSIFWKDLNKFSFNDYPFHNYLTYAQGSDGISRFTEVRNQSPLREFFVQNRYDVSLSEYPNLEPHKLLSAALNPNYSTYNEEDRFSPPYPTSRQKKSFIRKVTKTDRNAIGINEVKYSFLDLYENEWPQWDLIFSFVDIPGEAIIKFIKYYDEADLEKINGFIIQRKSASLN